MAVYILVIERPCRVMRYERHYSHSFSNLRCRMVGWDLEFLSSGKYLSFNYWDNTVNIIKCHYLILRLSNLLAWE